MKEEVARPRASDVVRDGTGAILVEFTLLLPALLLLLMGIFQFGLVFYNYIMVTNAAAAGARTFAYGRWDSNIYTDTAAAINSASSNLSGLTIALSVNGTACASNSACQTALQNAYTAAVIPPEPVSVTVQYACNGNAIMPTYLINLTGVCPLTSTTRQPVQ